MLICLCSPSSSANTISMYDIGSFDYSLVFLFRIFIVLTVTRLGNFLHFGQLFQALATISLPKSLTFLGNFCKGVKIYHFSSEIIFGQLLQTLAIFIWSHWLHSPSSRLLLLCGPGMPTQTMVKFSKRFQGKAFRSLSVISLDVILQNLFYCKWQIHGFQLNFVELKYHFCLQPTAEGPSNYLSCCCCFSGHFVNLLLGCT